ncbi:MAG: NrtR DNA-binding winged helix domain-containing protein [Alphaproteobacteria bacterium]
MTQVEEKEFLKNYNPSDYERLSLGADMVIFSISNEKTENYRKLTKKYFSVLLVKRRDFPCKGMWNLPGGFVNIDENIDDAADRILKKSSGLSNIYKEQLYTFGDVKRDPRMRIVTVAHISLINKDEIKEDLNENAFWFNIDYEEKGDTFVCHLSSSVENIEFVAKKVGDSYQIIKNDRIAFDHALIILTGILRLRNKIEYTDVVFNLLPEYFTLTELQTIYELILGKKLLAPAFRRSIKDKVEKTSKIQGGAGHRPSVLFRYKNRKI